MKTSSLKHLLIVLVVFTSPFIATAQIENGNIDINGGLSFIFPKAKHFLKDNSKAIKFSASSPCWFVGGDFGFANHLAVQTGLAFGKYSFDNNSDFVNKHYEMTSFGVYAGLKYYAFEFNNFHPYAQIQAQIVALHHHEYDTYNGQGQTNTISNTASKTYVAAFVGTRYDLSSRFYAFGEFGLNGWSVINAGIQFRVKK